jgi:uncharacterized membrane protein
MIKKIILSAFVTSSSLVFTQANEVIDFEKQILPILKEKCFKCHQKEHEEGGKVKKPKGGLVLDNAEGIKKGGKDKGAENVVAGKSADSWLLKTMSLPDSDDLAMPPEGKGDKVTKEEQELIKKWIDSGASFGSWTGA